MWNVRVMLPCKDAWPDSSLAFLLGLWQAVARVSQGASSSQNQRGQQDPGERSWPFLKPLLGCRLGSCPSLSLTVLSLDLGALEVPHPTAAFCWAQRQPQFPGTLLVFFLAKRAW